MGNRFDFTSPGAMFTDSLSKTLAERKLQQRQDLMDTLSMNADQRAAENAVREQAVSDQTIAASKQNMASEKQRADLERLKAFTQNMKIGDNPEEHGADAEMLELGRKYNAWTEQKPNTISTNQMDAVANIPARPKYGFVGTVEQRNKEDDEKRAGKVILSMLTDSNPQVRAKGNEYAQTVSLNGGVFPAQLLGTLLSKSVYAWDPVTKSIGNTGVSVPGNAEVLQGAPPDYSPTYMGVKIGANGEPISVFSQGGHINEYPGITRTGKDPDDAGMGISSIALAKHQLIASAVKPEQSSWFGFSSVPTDPGSLNIFRMSAHEIIGNANAPSEAKRLANQYIDDPAAYGAELAKMNNAGTNLSPQDLAAFMRLIQMVTTPDLDKILWKNPSGKAVRAGNKSTLK